MRLPVDEARRRFASGRVARLATVDRAGVPHLVPVTFALAGPDLVVFAVDDKPKTSTDLRRLRNIRATGRVSLLVDHYDDRDWRRLWWVRADGRGRVVDDEPGRSDLVEALALKYGQYADAPPRGVVVAMSVGWSGWSAR